MAAFYITEGPYLVSHGTAPDGAEKSHAKAGQKCVLGVPKGFSGQRTPYGGARWHVVLEQWVDTRTDAQRKTQASVDVVEARRGAYPPLSDLADAMFWQAQGDSSKMDAYMAQCAAVKVQFPKPGVE